ncbi:MAG: hypothetical protein ACOCP8_02110 [archaeon]
MSITKFIKNKREEYVKNKERIDSIKDINDGFCEQFAKEILENFHNALECCSGIFFEGIGSPIVIHVWVKYKDKYYDAEHPNGVEDWRNLNIFNVYWEKGYFKGDIFEKNNKKWKWDKEKKVYNSV